MKLERLLSALCKSGREGLDARPLKSQGQSFTRLGGKDNIWTAQLTVEQDVVFTKKDIRYHCCNHCLLEVNDSEPTAYTGSLTGMSGNKGF